MIPFNTMRVFLLFAILTQVVCQTYKGVTATKERKSVLGPFTVQNQADCELACNCARGAASGQACAQFSGVIKPINCQIYYYTASWCSFLGDFTVNTCILPIVEYQLEQDDFQTTTPSLQITTLATTETPTTTTTLPTATTAKVDLTTTSTAMHTTARCPAGGVWGEWTTEPCPTTCGSCSNITRTRTCTTRCGNCPCDGPDTDVGPCGISTCPISAGKTCCANYKHILNYDAILHFCGTGKSIPPVVCPGPGSTSLSP